MATASRKPHLTMDIDTGTDEDAGSDRETKAAGSASEPAGKTPEPGQKQKRKQKTKRSARKPKKSESEAQNDEYARQRENFRAAIQRQLQDGDVCRRVAIERIESLARDVETAVAAAVGDTDPDGYAYEARRVLFALRHTSMYLAAAVLDGSVTASSIPRMANDKLYPASVARRRERLRDLIKQNVLDKQALEQTTSAAAASAEYECPNCHSFRAHYRTVQTRRSDEAETVFMRCLVCSHRWKL